MIRRTYNVYVVQPDDSISNIEGLKRKTTVKRRNLYARSEKSEN